MLILLSESVAKVLPVPYGEPKLDRAIFYIDDEDLKYIYHPDYAYETYQIKEMLTGNEYQFWGHSILHFIHTNTIL